MDGKLSHHLSATLLESAYGFSTACVIGIIVGYFMGMHKWFDELMDPWIATRRARDNHRGAINVKRGGDVCMLIASTWRTASNFVRSNRSFRDDNESYPSKN
jgi:hypothetical protein